MSDLYLLSAQYDGDRKKAYLKFYDTEKEEIVKWYDNTNHKPYCLSKDMPWELDKNQAVTSHPGFEEFETVKKYDSLHDKDIMTTKILAEDPRSIGSGARAIRNLIDNAWEANIRYYQCFMYDREFICGIPYTLEDDKPKRKEVELNNELVNTLESHDIEKQLKGYMMDWAKLLQHPIPNYKRLAMDIEVGGSPGEMPDVEDADDPVIAIGFASKNFRKMLVLRYKEEKDPTVEDGEVELFDNEKELLRRSFEIMNEYPMIISYNGDDFDLKYLYNRAKRFRLDSPIKMRQYSAEVNDAIHIDVYRFFRNRSIKGYAFSNAYRSNSLDDVSEALLGIGKIEVGWVTDLTLQELTNYCMRDTQLTYDLTSYDNNLVMRLITLMTRISRMTMEDVTRMGVSRWILAMLESEHRKLDWIIPTSEELEAMKGESATKAIIKGKKYKGAIVKDPTPGAHFWVKVFDFACLDDKTEALTRDGWKKYNELHIGDKILTFNKEKEVLEYQPIRNIFTYNFSGNLVAIDRRYLNFRGTKNHRFIFKNKRTINKNWQTDRADSLKTYITIPCSAPYKGGKTEFTDDEIRLFGWLISEGEFPKYRLKIYQSAGRYINEIKSLLNRLELKYSVYTRKREEKKKEYVFSILNEDQKQIRNILYNGKRLTKELLNLPNRQSNILLKTLMKGDGCISRNTYTTSDPKLAEQVQELVIKLGKRGYIYSFGDQYLIGITDTDEIYLGLNNKYPRKKDLYKEEFYEGKVWCPNVQNGFFLARRNKKHFITGNSLYPTAIKNWNLSYETILCNHKECRDNIIPGTPHWVCKKRRGLTSLLVGSLRDIRVFWYKPLSKDESIPKLERDYYYVIQQALKVFINASYGVFGAKSFPLYAPPLAESITAVGRFAMDSTIEEAEGLQIPVLGGDTDSVFLHDPDEKQEKAIIQWADDELGIELEAEKTYRYIILSDRKKNYLGIYPDGSMDVKGLTGKKRHVPPFIKEAFSDLTEVLANVQEKDDLEDAKDKISILVSDTYNKLKNKEIEPAELAFSVQMGKEIEAYDTNPPHVKAAKILERRGEEVNKGDIVKYVVTRWDVKPIDMIRMNEIDIEKYEGYLENTFIQLLDALGMSFDALVGKPQQTGLDEWF